ncbi:MULTISPECIES: ATP-dependent helicase [Bacillaceae]|uniref:ATP-dependent helicase n=1 Tax=Bacillaceae TaxID=186817 RepID=UPI000309EB7D|nr:MULTISPECIES: ATP-dependent helicase [Bacillaceae]KAB7670274.1 ATP-dependent helicase [Bacillus sp. B1-b2]MED3794447.1 ATP-dependent helicase [Niallia alba]SLL35299.1 ATP-dependent DNA helicase II [Mycobacteroides abscessus subsp. abscessus]HEO8421578.1 ATP-dependent helicase [Yersinia enterocolitica]
MDISVAIELENSLSEIPIDQNFKLYAGPGAGKTTFLTNHIRNILKKSHKLKKSRQIACITYTNTAVNTLIQRLQGCTNSTEVSTIHSFCYKFIVKPYIWVLNDPLIPLEKMDGHEEIKLRKSQLRDFKTRSQQLHFADDKSLVEALGKLKWILEAGEPVLKFIKFNDGRIGSYSIKKQSYMLYKQLYWTEGKISHDDVLYFTYRILKEKPEVIEIIRARFPYILIDEFQDTSPIQTEILKMIGEKETCIGIIGDICQSIYSFQGANVDLFREFSLNEMKVYILSGNRRSTNQIINVLNHMRESVDFKQYSPTNLDGPAPMILVGDSSEADSYLKDNLGQVMFLSYKNTNQPNVNILVDDSDGDRSWRIYYLVQALELAKNLDIKNALKYMKQAYRKTIGFTEKEALENLRRLINDYEVIQNESITDLHNNYIVGHYDVTGKITRGKVKALYDKLTYIQLVSQIKIIENGLINFKTIHQSKGEEYETVCVSLPSKGDGKEIDFLIKPDMNKESHRVYYVALSRAQNRLIIKMEAISDENRMKLVTLGFEVIQLREKSTLIT